MTKNILIVGATSGLGRQLVKLYAGDGCVVGIVGRRENLLAELQQQFPANIKTLKADINHEHIAEQLSGLINSMNGIDIMIITASVVEFNQELEDAPEMRTINTNVKGYTRVINTAWHYFKQKGNGQIVGVTSIAAARGNKLAPAYHASKAFQSRYLESLRIKAKHDKNNITITELVPGYIDTAMGKGDRLFWIASVEKAARQSKKAIAKKKARAFITKRWWFVYHIQRLLPIFIYDSLVNGSWKLKRKT
jgi:short-subunit dehydrogenase